MPSYDNRERTSFSEVFETAAIFELTKSLNLSSNLTHQFCNESADSTSATKAELTPAASKSAELKS